MDGNLLKFEQIVDFEALFYVKKFLLENVAWCGDMSDLIGLNSRTDLHFFGETRKFFLKMIALFWVFLYCNFLEILPED